MYCLILAILPVTLAQIQAFGPTKDANGNLVRPCFTTTDGYRSNGEEWVTFSNDWKVKCDNGSITIIGCVASQRANFAVIPIGETLEVNNFWHKCEYIDDKQNVRYTEEASCPLRGRELKINSTIRNGLFEMRCLENMWDIVGCYYYTADGEAKLIKIGESAQNGNFMHKCEKLPNSTKVMYSYEATACAYNGTIYQKGETWVNGLIKFQCQDKGAYEGVACLNENGDELKIGEDKVVSGAKGTKRLQRCFREGRTIIYQDYPCGDKPFEKSCSPPPAEESKPQSVSLIAPTVSGSLPTGQSGVESAAMTMMHSVGSGSAAMPLGMAPHGVNRLSSDSGARTITSSAVLSTGQQFQSADFQPIMQHTHRSTKVCTETGLQTEIVNNP